MMSGIPPILRDRRAAAAAELAMVTPVLLALMFGSVELGNFFAAQHALEKQVRDGARFASRLEINSDYACGTPATVFQDADASTKIINVTKNGVVAGSGSPRWTDYWDRVCTGSPQTLTVTIRCVAKTAIDTDNDGFSGIYTSLDGTTIPVVKVAGAVRYRSVLSALGFNTTDICLQAQSEAAVQGL
jgi:Flp pilus assembly protein TadG